MKVWTHLKRVGRIIYIITIKISPSKTHFYTITYTITLYNYFINCFIIIQLLIINYWACAYLSHAHPRGLYKYAVPLRALFKESLWCSPDPGQLHNYTTIMISPILYLIDSTCLGVASSSGSSADSPHERPSLLMGDSVPTR